MLVFMFFFPIFVLQNAKWPPAVHHNAGHGWPRTPSCGPLTTAPRKAADLCLGFLGVRQMGEKTKQKKLHSWMKHDETSKKSLFAVGGYQKKKFIWKHDESWEERPQVHGSCRSSSTWAAGRCTSGNTVDTLSIYLMHSKKQVIQNSTNSK